MLAVCMAPYGSFIQCRGGSSMALGAFLLHQAYRLARVDSRMLEVTGAHRSVGRGRRRG